MTVRSWRVQEAWFVLSAGKACCADSPDMAGVRSDRALVADKSSKRSRAQGGMGTPVRLLEILRSRVCRNLGVCWDDPREKRKGLRAAPSLTS